VEVAVEAEQEGVGEGEGEDDSDEPEVLRLIGTVHPNMRSRAPRNHYNEDQLRMEALETIPTNVLSLEQRRLLEEHGYVQVQEDREERNRELIDTSTEDEPEIRMEEGEVERLLRVEAEAEVEERGAAEDGDTAGEEEEEVL
jgi:hypothetical protein